MKKIYILAIMLISLNSFSQNISTLYGTTWGYSGDGGLASVAQLNGNCNMVFDDNGNLYITDANNNMIRKIDNSGIITTIAGTGVAGYSGDGGLATAAQLNGPYDIAIDANGNLFFTGFNYVIRKIDNSGIITTIAGTGVAGYSGDGGLATSAEMNFSFGITFDTSGNLLITESVNNVIRKIDNTGIITTIAGTGVAGYSGDGGLATSAQLSNVRTVTFNALGEMYITDGGNHLIRKIDNSGIISTVAGNNSQGYSGDGGLATDAQLNFPRDLIFDSNNNFYFSSSSNHTIRKVDNSGIITTIAGTGIVGYSGDGGLATSAQLNSPYGIIFDTNGNLLISEYNNSIIRQVNNATLSTNNFSIEKETLIIYPNPSTDFIKILGLSKAEKFSIYNTLGTKIYRGTITINDKINIQELNNGIYFLKLDI